MSPQIPHASTPEEQNCPQAPGGPAPFRLCSEPVRVKLQGRGICPLALDEAVPGQLAPHNEEPLPALILPRSPPSRAPHSVSRAHSSRGWESSTSEAILQPGCGCTGDAACLHRRGAGLSLLPRVSSASHTDEEPKNAGRGKDPLSALACCGLAAVDEHVLNT